MEFEFIKKNWFRVNLSKFTDNDLLVMTDWVDENLFGRFMVGETNEIYFELEVDAQAFGLKWLS